MSLHSVPSFRRYIATLKAATISEQWDGHVAKIGGKVFALIGDAATPIVFKVSEISFDGLTTLEGVDQAGYFAKRAWVRVDKGAPLTDAELKAYIRASYDIVAGKLTKKMRAELGLD
jgi:predicted DNA-binding protein (MmcQ/YjbR family)